MFLFYTSVNSVGICIFIFVYMGVVRSRHTRMHRTVDWCAMRSGNFMCHINYSNVSFALLVRLFIGEQLFATEHHVIPFTQWTDNVKVDYHDNAAHFRRKNRPNNNWTLSTWFNSFRVLKFSKCIIIYVICYCCCQIKDSLIKNETEYEILDG